MDELLVLQGDYDAAGLEEFKRDILAGKKVSNQYQIISTGIKNEDCPNPDCPCRTRGKNSGDNE